MTGQSAGVFWIWSRGWRNLSQSAWRKFIDPEEDTGMSGPTLLLHCCLVTFTKYHKNSPFSLMSWRATSCWNFSKLSVSSLMWNKMRKGIPSSVSSWKKVTNTQSVKDRWSRCLFMAQQMDNSAGSVNPHTLIYTSNIRPKLTKRSSFINHIKSKKYLMLSWCYICKSR